MIKFPKEVNINDYYTVTRESKHDFDEAIIVLAEEMKKAGVENPENIAKEIAYSDFRHCKWGKKFEAWTDRTYHFDEDGHSKAVFLFKKERAEAINSLMTLKKTENHPLYEDIELYLEEGEIKPLYFRMDEFTAREAKTYMDLIVHCLSQGGNGRVILVEQYDSSPYPKISEEDEKLGITNPI